MEKEMFGVAKTIALRYNRFFYKDFRRNAVDSEDLIQEALIVTMVVLKKFPDKSAKVMKKLVNQAVGWRMNYLKDRAKKVKNDSYVSPEFIKDAEEDYAELADIISEGSEDSAEEVQVSMEEMNALRADLRRRERHRGAYHYFKPDFAWEDLRKLVTPKEYDVLYLIFHEDMNSKKAAEKLGLTGNGVRFITRRALGKVKKHYYPGE